MKMYIHELHEWPNFQWDYEKLTTSLSSVRHKQGYTAGRMKALGFSLSADAVLNTLTTDVLQSSAIEGDMLNEAQVRSSVARKLGIEAAGLVSSDRYVDGVVEMMLDATQNYDLPLSKERLFGWHAALFPSGYSGIKQINVGCWRDDAKGAIQVVSGSIGREHVHYEAPVAVRLEREMEIFLEWFNNNMNIDLVLKAFIAHFWFVTLHPFEDGNGRIARAITDMLLARSEVSSERFYSMSAQIRKERDAYYDILENAQKGELNITELLLWFLGCMNRALDGVDEVLINVLRKAHLWEMCANLKLNERQRLMLNKLTEDFLGKLTSSQWAKMSKCSQDTAVRDIKELEKYGLLVKNSGGGRSTSYSLLVD